MTRPLRETINPKSLTLIGIPRDLRKKEITDFDTFGSESLDKVKEFVNSYMISIDRNFMYCKGIFFYGSNGQGKTLLSSIILKEAYRHRYSCRRCTYTDYLAHYTRLWNLNGSALESEQDMFTLQYTLPEFLVLEEIGKERDTALSVPVLEDLLRQREDSSLPTIICTNLSPKDFGNRYGASTISLVTGNMTPVEFTGEDHRKMFYNER